MFACVLNLKQEVRLALESGHCKTMVRTSKVSHQGGSPPEPNNWASMVAPLGTFARPLHVAMPCVGIDGCGTALKLMSVPFVANNVMDIEGRYEEYLTQHLGQSNLHLGPTKGDVNSISLQGLERPEDMIVSGPPCPPWAGNGKHEGQADARSTVFLSVVKMIIGFIKAGELKAAVLEKEAFSQSNGEHLNPSSTNSSIYSNNRFRSFIGRSWSFRRQATRLPSKGDASF